MRGGYELRTLQTLTDSTAVPPWADFVDLVNDGGRPLRLRLPGAVTQLMRTGDRFPIPHDQVQFSVDSDLNGQVPASSLPTFAFVSSEVALIMGPPSTTPTETLGQEEAVVNAAGERQIVGPAGAMTTQPIGLANQGAGKIYLGGKAGDATAKKTQLAAGQTIDWWGPLFVFTDVGANQTLDCTFRVKRITT